MTQETRIYVVTDHAGASRLVRAPTPARAVNFVQRGAFAVRVASQTDLENLLSNGTTVETVPPSPAGRKPAAVPVPDPAQADLLAAA